MEHQPEIHNELTDEEIKNIILSAKKLGLRDTVDLYLLDYIKHCFLEDNQLAKNIDKLKNAIDHISDNAVKKDVEDVLSSLQCVQSEYNEYIEDMRVFAHAGAPHRATSRLLDDLK
ncbi:MAG: hypothetical protein K0S09_2337 [Sphingobacteriaceae bacterium]|jgi:hypothetical protein|nr:hypothetical protein [Sphingobacteriaceae bacterium]